MKRIRKRPKGEPTTALINIVFLILIFFMVAGTLTPSQNASLDFVEADGPTCCTPADALLISSDGKLTVNGADVSSVQAYVTTHGMSAATTRLAPDRNLPAHDLLKLVKSLQDHGVTQITILTENVSS